MIQHRPMVSIWRPSDSGSRGTLDTELIQCVYVQEPQIHKLWCFSLDKVTCKIHTTAQVEAGAGTVGEFTTNHLAENGRIVLIIGQLLSTEVSNFLVSPIFQWKWIVVYWKPAIPHCAQWLGTCRYLQSEQESYARGYFIEILQSPGVVPSLLVWITCLVVRLTHAMLRVASMTNSFIVGVAIVWVLPPQVEILSPILGSIIVVTIRRVRLLNNFVANFCY